MKNRNAVFLIFLSLATAGGCFKTVNSIERAQPIGQANVVNDKRIQTDPDLNDIAVIRGVHEASVGDLARIEVDVYNSRPTEERFNYKFEWYDLDGMHVDSPTSIWKPITIQGKEQLSLSATAPNPRAKDFKLKIQESKH